MLDCIAGNALTVQALQAALHAGRLSHSVLLYGEKGTGTGFAARCLAADYLYPNSPMEANKVMTGQSEECIEVAGEGASGEIRIDSIRQIRKEIFSTALTAAGRVVIVYDTQNFNGFSANALLKVLEEPPEGVLFILTASNAAAVLPTIRSRCVSFSFGAVSMEECASYLRKHRPTGRGQEFLSQVFGGKIGTALECIDDPQRKGIFDDALRLAQCAEKGNAYDAMLLLNRWEKDKPAAKQLLEDVQAVSAACMRGIPVQGLSASKAAPIGKLCQQVRQQLMANANAKLVFCYLAAQLANL